MPSHVIDKDRGWNRIKNEVMKGRREPVVAVGVLQEDAQRNEEDGVTIGQVATFVEYGTETAPARSFIRDTIDMNRARYSKMILALNGHVVEGKMTTKRALELVGTRVQADIRNRMAQGIPPPNAPSTIAKKKSSTPTIDTGQLKGAVNYEVRQ